MVSRSLPMLALWVACACNPAQPSERRSVIATPTSAVRIAQALSLAGNSLLICSERELAADSKYPCSSTLPCTCFDFDEDGELVDPSTGEPAVLEGLCPSENLPKADWQFDYTLFEGLGCVGTILNGPDGDYTCYDLSDLEAQANPNASVEELPAGLNENEVFCLTAPSTPFCQATRQFIVRPSATVVGDIANSGTGGIPTFTLVDANAVVNGSVLSVPPVLIGNSVQISGDVTSAGSITIGLGTMIGGAVSPNTPVSLPPLPTLPTFPAVLDPGFSANLGQTVPVPPGNYQQLNVNGGTLVLGDGDYFIDILNIAQGQIIVTPGTRLFVRSNFNYNLPFLNSMLQVQPVLLGYYGPSISFNTTFLGTLIAPSATIEFNPQNSLFIGEFYARDLIVNAGANSLICADGPDL